MIALFLAQNGRGAWEGCVEERRTFRVFWSEQKQTKAIICNHDCRAGHSRAFKSRMRKELKTKPRQASLRKQKLTTFKKPGNKEDLKRDA